MNLDALVFGLITLLSPPNLLQIIEMINYVRS